MLWFDVFVDSQHVNEGPSKTPQWYMSTFKSRIARIGCLLLVVDAWNNPTPLKRAWYALAEACVLMEAMLANALFCAGAYWSCMR